MCIICQLNILYMHLQTHINGQKFIYLFNKYVLSTYYVLNTFVGATDTVIRWSNFPHLWNSYSSDS